jgi:hypothetical protein
LYFGEVAKLDAVKKSTLKSILNQADVAPEDFLEQL